MTVRDGWAHTEDRPCRSHTLQLDLQLAPPPVISQEGASRSGGQRSEMARLLFHLVPGLRTGSTEGCFIRVWGILGAGPRLKCNTSVPKNSRHDGRIIFRICLSDL